MVTRLKNKLFAITEVAILVFSVWSALSLDFKPALAQYSWTDTIRIYKDITVVCTDIRTITNNETSPIDVKVNITYTDRIHLLQYYELSANQTDLIIISEGRVIRSGDTYYGLGPGQKLCFSVEAKPTGLVVGDITIRIGVELCARPPVGGIWIPVDKLKLLAPWISLASAISIAAVVTITLFKRRKKKQ